MNESLLFLFHFAIAMARNKEVFHRNHFTLSLFRKLFKCEAEHMFTDNAIVRYLSTPLSATTINEIKNFKWTNTQDEVTAIREAENLASRVFDRPNRYELSDNMLDTAVRRLTLYGKFKSFEEFENHYSFWANEFESEVGKAYTDLKPGIGNAIQDLVYDIYKAEDIFLRQNGILDIGMHYSNIIRLLEGYVMFEVMRDNNFRYNVNLSSPISSSDFYRDTIGASRKFVLVNPHINIVGRIMLMPIKLVGSGISMALGSHRINFTLECSEPDADSLVYDVSSDTLKHFYTLLSRLPDVLKKLGKANNNYCILLNGKEDKSTILQEFLGFEKAVIEGALNTKLNITIEKPTRQWGASLPKGECFFVCNYNTLKEQSQLAGFGIDLY